MHWHALCFLFLLSASWCFSPHPQVEGLRGNSTFEAHIDNEPLGDVGHRDRNAGWLVGGLSKFIYPSTFVVLHQPQASPFSCPRLAAKLRKRLEVEMAPQTAAPAARLEKDEVRQNPGLTGWGARQKTPRNQSQRRIAESIELPCRNICSTEALQGIDMLDLCWIAVSVPIRAMPPMPSQIQQQSGSYTRAPWEWPRRPRCQSWEPKIFEDNVCWTSLNTYLDLLLVLSLEVNWWSCGLHTWFGCILAPQHKSQNVLQSLPTQAAKRFVTNADARSHWRSALKPREVHDGTSFKDLDWQWTNHWRQSHWCGIPCFDLDMQHTEMQTWKVARSGELSWCFVEEGWITGHHQVLVHLARFLHPTSSCRSLGI